MIENWNPNGNFLFTEEEYNKAKSREKVLPLKCLCCGEIFYKSKHEIQKIFNKNEKGTEFKFCSLKCKGKYITEYNTTIVKCEQCDKEFRKINSEIKKTVHNFCCKSCAAKYNNKHRKKCKCNRNNNNKRKKYYDIELHKINCNNCNKEIYVKTNDIECYCYECINLFNIKKHHHNLYTENGNKIINPNSIEKNRQIQLELVRNKKHIGWTNRNKSSYPEQFFQKVLDNNNINYKREYKINKKDLNIDDSSNYFLDFKIGNNIDLEIDGKQHKYIDRCISDKIRDQALKDNGWKVYRIDWNEINSETGKKIMEEKINIFLQWLKNNI